jgi:hypothetical protein
MKKSKQHMVDNKQGKEKNNGQDQIGGKKICFLLFLSLYAVYCLLPTCLQAEINNTLAYSVSHTSSTSYNDLNVIGTKTVAQTILATANETWYGIGIYLDRIGLSSSTDSVYLRLRGNGVDACGTPDTSLAPKRKAYVKVIDIPDGDADASTMPPDSVGRGYLIWFIFDSPITVYADNCYTIFLNAPKTDNSNRICWNAGSNGYADGNCYYATTSEGSWSSYGYDLNFRVIKDKYALVAIRRFPFNLKGALTISSDVDHSSVTYLDSLHQWLNTTNSVGGRWGTGLGGNIAGNDLWFGRAFTADSTGTYSGDPIPFYFHGLDTTSNYYKDTIDNYISRRWMDSNHGYVDCSGTTNCADSTNVVKWLNYMLNRPSVFGKMYKAGIWVNHGTSGENTINIGFYGGETTRLGDSSGTAYHHAHRTLASGRFKFVWYTVEDPGISNYQHLNYVNWQSKIDSLNLNSGIIDSKIFRDGVKSYLFNRIGRNASAVPESTYKFFNRTIAKACGDSNWISVVYTHLGKSSGLDAANIDSIRQVYNNAASYGLWIPSSKQLLNQQAASMFSQITVDRPSGSKRRVNIKSLYDWSWGSHVPDREEVYYLTFIAYAPESLIVTLNGSDTLTDSNMTSQQDVATDYNDAASGVNNRRAMSWVGMYNRTSGRKTVVYAPPSAPPSGKRNRNTVIEQLLNYGQRTVYRKQETGRRTK